MKHTIKVSENGTFFTIVTEGDGDFDGIISFLKDLVSHPQWKPGNKILLDHRALKLDNIKTSGVVAVSEYFKSISAELGKGKIALIMRRDVDFGIARAWEMITEYYVDINIYVFHEFDEAIAWLEY
ncbi:MAG: hypothetical protein PF692_02705 [Kiritimatiellae bacterium]|jgi:hypothetical protein|nr:hypothetical protein [Kiritimatiellia bacterium]